MDRFIFLGFEPGNTALNMPMVLTQPHGTTSMVLGAVVGKELIKVAKQWPFVSETWTRDACVTRSVLLPLSCCAQVL